MSCGRTKTLRSLGKSTPSEIKVRPRKVAAYVREIDLQERFNRTLFMALGLPAGDYYGRMDFEKLTLLKNSLARIHDIITLKLTLALAQWVVTRFHLGQEASEKLILSVNTIHPNAAGFDLDCVNPNLIGEVKGCIPVNGGGTFGAAQLRGLTNDVLQMLGYPAGGKQADKLSTRSKIHRTSRREALKFLALYDSPAVRQAVEKWRGSLANSSGHVLADRELIRDLPERERLLSEAVYLVFLKPSV